MNMERQTARRRSPSRVECLMWCGGGVAVTATLARVGDEWRADLRNAYGMDPDPSMIPIAGGDLGEVAGRAVRRAEAIIHAHLYGDWSGYRPDDYPPDVWAEMVEQTGIADADDVAALEAAWERQEAECLRAGIPVGAEAGRGQ